MKRKSAHQQLVEEADAWCKAIVVHWQGGKCLREGQYPPSCGGGMQGAHILRKGAAYNAIRHDLLNVIGLCRNHHIFWAHKNELEFYEWIEEIFPGRIAELRERARMRQWRCKVDLKELICVLKDIARKEGIISQDTVPDTRTSPRKRIASASAPNPGSE